MKSLFTFFLVLVYSIVGAQSPKMGKWKGVIHYGSTQVPFIFEIAPSGGDVPEITFINGAERRIVSNALIKGDSIFIPMDPFDVTLKASFSGTTMTGLYVKHYRGASIPFTASFGEPRFMKNSVKTNPRIEKKWAMEFSPNTPSSSKGVGLFTQFDDVVTATILTQTSDYRYFEGILDGDSMRLSSFDGAHAFMILAKKTGTNTWSGDMIFDNLYKESWTATYDKDATLEDPFEMVSIDPGVHKPYYDLLGAGSGKNAIDPSSYKGKVLIIQLFGTWCPNSHDQTKYLVKWHKSNKDKNLAILASSFESNYSQEYGLRRLSEYRESNGIEYDLVLGGRLSKRAAATPFPFMDRIEAFPTLVILDKKGYVRYVHSYFNGPATGDYYSTFDTRFNEIIDELLAE